MGLHSIRARTHGHELVTMTSRLPPPQASHREIGESRLWKKDGYRHKRLLLAYPTGLPASGRGRKSILSDVAKRKVLKDIKIDPKLSAVKLAAETSRIMGRSVSAETVRNVIRHAGYSSRKARKKPFISLQNQKKHLEFAKTYQLKTELSEESYI
ncbi:transposable element Tcb2 transposase [Trichonephila clavipes]|nr:transposable element Tcb2 transposase [Trichonephila clavipes]